MYLACARSGQPSVWTTFSNGCSTSQTSLTPSAHTCGSERDSPRPLSAAPVRCPQQPSASTVARATTSAPGSKLAFSPPALSRPLSPVRTPTTAPSSTSSLCPAVSARTYAPASSACSPSQRLSSATRDDVVAVVAERRRGRLQRHGPLAVEHEVDRLRPDRAVVRPGVVVREELAQRRRVHHRARELVRAGHAALLDHGHGHLPERLGQLGVVLEQLQQADGAGQAGLAPAHDGHADLDPLVLGIRRGTDELRRRVDRRRVLDRRDRHRAQPPLRAFTASVSFGTILLRSPTMPRSENSKIGAFASLLMATMFSEPCMPTLCWMAPEMPAAR